MKTSQSFAFYPTDFLMGTVLFSAEEVGAYIRLLCYQWQEGSLPSDEKLLAKYASTTPEIITTILGKFRAYPDGRLRNKKMEEVRKSLNTYKKSRSDNAKKRWGVKMHMHNTCTDDAEHKQCLPIPSPSPLPSPSPVKPPKPPRGAVVYSDEFLKFWQAYPKKKVKGKAWEAWQRANPRPPLDVMLAAVSRDSADPDWRKQGGQFIPLPATWLNGRRWEDEGLLLTTTTTPRVF